MKLYTFLLLLLIWGEDRDMLCKLEMNEKSLTVPKRYEFS